MGIQEVVASWYLQMVETHDWVQGKLIRKIESAHLVEVKIQLYSFLAFLAASLEVLKLPRFLDISLLHTQTYSRFGVRVQVLFHCKGFRTTKPVDQEYIFNIQLVELEVVILGPACSNPKSKTWTWLSTDILHHQARKQRKKCYYPSSLDALKTEPFEQKLLPWIFHQPTSTEIHQRQKKSNPSQTKNIRWLKSLATLSSFIPNI